MKHRRALVVRADLAADLVDTVVRLPAAMADLVVRVATADLVDRAVMADRAEPVVATAHQEVREAMVDPAATINIIAPPDMVAHQCSGDPLCTRQPD